MPSLEELLMPNNRLEWLPKELAALKLLRRLDVSRNPLASPPVEVAARGLDSVKRYFRNFESQNRDTGGGPAEEKHVKVPNQVKVIFIGHSEAGKSQVIKGLESTKAALPQPREIGGRNAAGTGTSTGGVGGAGATPRFLSTSNSTPNSTSSGNSGSGSGSRSNTSASSSSSASPATACPPAGTPHQQNLRRGAPPRTPPPPPLPSTQDDEGWQVVGTARPRSLPVHSTPLPNRSQERSGTPTSYGLRTPGGSSASIGGGGGRRRWETVAAQGGSVLGRGSGSGGAAGSRRVRRVSCSFLGGGERDGNV